MRGLLVGMTACVLAGAAAGACSSFSSGDAGAASGADASADADVGPLGADAADSLAPAGPTRKLFVIGGQTDVSASAKTYIGAIEPTGIVWTEGAPLDGPRQATCAVNVGDRIYVVGGLGTSLDFKGAASMRPGDANPQWVPETAPTDPRQGHGCAEVSGELYVTGGGAYASSSQKATTERGVVGADGGVVWNDGPALPSAVQDHASATALGRVYVLGGYPCRSGVLSASVGGDGNLGAWADAGALRETRYGATATAVDARIFVVGGLGGTSCSKGTDAVDLLRVDAAGTIVSTTGQRLLPEARSYAGAAVVDGRLYVLGGNIGSGTPTPTNSVVSAEIRSDDTLGPWVDETRLPVALSRFALVVR